MLHRLLARLVVVAHLGGARQNRRDRRPQPVGAVGDGGCRRDAAHAPSEAQARGNVVVVEGRRDARPAGGDRRARPRAKRGGEGDARGERRQGGGQTGS